MLEPSRPRRLKIIWGMDRDVVAEDARLMLRKKRDRDIERDAALPLGISPNIAKYHHSCDDCGGIFWDSDPYGYRHPKCPGSSKVGFS